MSVKYSTVHDRLRNKRGNARDQRCTDCGKQAHDWSYDGLDQNELVDQGHRYSPDSERYVPRCRSCHNRHDGKVPPYHSGETHPRAKLSDAEVESIREARASGERAVLIAARYGVTETHVNRLIRKGRS